jgi:hypothetical protein
LNNSARVELSPIVPREEYSKLKHLYEKRGSVPVSPEINFENENTQVLRKNLFVTNFRKDYKINNDFPKKDVINNVS